MSSVVMMPPPRRGPEVEVRPADTAVDAAWNAYVEDHAEGSFFHRIEWRDVLQRAFGHRSRNLCALRGGTIVGVLPLAEIRSRIFGHSLISTPFCVYGGAIADDEPARAALEAAACRLAEQLGVDSLEMRERSARHADWPTKDLYVTFRKEIDPDPEVNFKAIPKKQRAMVRKGIEAGLQSEFDDGVDRVYRAYSESVRNLGTPVFGKKYFRILRECFGEDCSVLTVTHQGEIVSSVMSFYFRDEVLPYYGGGVAAARDLKGNDFLYWELMRRSCERGVRIFDYGRSKQGTGSYRFKKHWGFQPEPLHYAYHLVRARQMPNVSPTNPKYKLMIDAWRRLPLPITRFVGPYIARYLA